MVPVATGIRYIKLVKFVLVPCITTLLQTNGSAAFKLVYVVKLCHLLDTNHDAGVKCTHGLWITEFTKLTLTHG